MSALPTQGTPAPQASASHLPDGPQGAAGHDELPPAASLTSIVVRRRQAAPAAAPAAAPETSKSTAPRPETPKPATPEPATPASTDAPASPRAAVAETARPSRAEAASRAIEAEPAPAPPAADSGGPRPAEALLQHWDGLRHGRARPRVEELDDTAIARAWPNSFLLRVGGTPEHPRLEPAKTFGGNSSAHIDATAIDWMVALGREVARDGRPLHEADDLPTPAGDREHGVVAVPFGDPAGTVDHVLCHLYPRDAAPAAPPPPQATRTPPPPQVRRPRPGQLFGRR